jgi:hypothetical protein
MPRPMGVLAKSEKVGSRCDPSKAIYDDAVVLPHEKLYLEHLPTSDRYFKSFMHRDAVNFNVITKSVFKPVMHSSQLTR